MNNVVSDIYATTDTTKTGTETEYFQIDATYELVDHLSSPLCKDVWRDKYRWDNETWDEMATRVVNSVYFHDADAMQQRLATIEAIQKCLWMPAGRILAGSGTPKRVTLLNCFVNAELEDDMASIATGLGNIMLTMQQGGGIGTDFSPLRPPMAILRRTGSTASGPGPFLDTWDSACTTIRSAGDRRGAMMGTLGCWHPFLPEFIKAKNTRGRWTNFNVSVLVTDAFMAAVQDDEEWWLHHPAEPAFQRPVSLQMKDFEDDDGIWQYVYSVHQARTLWDSIIQNTYDYAEPGVIFIDRVNDYNNLQPWEHIQCTNPCGEQPLPPHGCCDLGAVNISRMVRAPFTDSAKFNWDLLKDITALGVRFLDNVIDVTNYPLPEQREEELRKRRIGIGISGLADAMHMLGLRYGSPQSCNFAEEVMRTVATASYHTSLELAKEKGCAPIFSSPGDRQVLSGRPFIQKLPETIRDGCRDHGLRNGVLLTIAPTGTTSIAFGNNSSGLEPVFAHSMRRKVRQGDDSWQEYDEFAYGARLYMARNPGSTLDDLPTYMNVCADVRIHEHVRIQEVCQKWVDASISKTINVPEDIPFEDFRDVYQLAYDSDCKGCTTYRPSDVRGSVLSTGAGEDNPGTQEEPRVQKVVERPDLVPSCTVKLRWPGLNSALYVTLGYVNGQPYEVFINSKDQKSLDWVMALTILMSMALRQGTPLGRIAEEFGQVHALEGGWAPDNGSGKQRYWPSLISYIGHHLNQLAQTELYTIDAPPELAPGGSGKEAPDSGLGPLGLLPLDLHAVTAMRQCVDCHQYTVTSLNGCLTCTNCGWSKCT